MKGARADDCDEGRAFATNLCATCGEKVAHVGDFGFAGGVVNADSARAEGGGKDYVFRCAHAWEIQIYIVVFAFKVIEGLDMKVYWACAD